MGILLLVYRSITCGRNSHSVIIMASWGCTLGRKMSFWHAFILGVCMTAGSHVELCIRPHLESDAALSEWGVSDCLGLLGRGHLFQESFIRNVCHREAWLTEGFFFVPIEYIYSEMYRNCSQSARCTGNIPEELPALHLDIFCAWLGAECQSLLLPKRSHPFSSHRMWGWAALSCSVYQS